MIRQDFELNTKAGGTALYEGQYNGQYLGLCADRVAKRFPKVILEGKFARDITFKLSRKCPRGPATQVVVKPRRSVLGTMMVFLFSSNPYDSELTGLFTGLVIDKRLGRPDPGTKFWVQVEVLAEGGGDTNEDQHEDDSNNSESE